MKGETAGDPIRSLKWTRRSTRKLARELSRRGLRVCANTVARLLKKLGYSLQVNQKRLSGRSLVEQDRAAPLSAGPPAAGPGRLGRQQQRRCPRLEPWPTTLPARTSKWNPIEHHLFSEISKNWQGRPLESFQTVLNYIRATTTTTGLTVKAFLMRRKYSKGIKISDQQMQSLCIEKHHTWPKQFYVLSPAP